APLGSLELHKAGFFFFPTLTLHSGETHIKSKFFKLEYAILPLHLITFSDLQGWFFFRSYILGG
ncbi:MAG TPA: hypothetical protein PLN47_03120, partial [Candidatus Atribacteria bacterium]|nr:hypothetical protein [Candidatus Atribacteria bacterium]